MKNNKVIIITISIIFLLGAYVVFSTTSFGKTINWAETFNERRTNPYDLKVFYEELPKIFEEQEIRTVYHTPFNYLSEHLEYGSGDHVAQGTYMIIGNTEYLDYLSVDELLSFVSAGNHLFISDYQIPQYLKEQLSIEIDSMVNKDKKSILSFENKEQNKNKTNIDRIKTDYYFSNFGVFNDEGTVLGYTEQETSEVNFIKIKYYNGSIFLHLEPKIFTNYNLLKEDRYKYVESVLSYLPEKDIYYDSFYKNYDSYNGNVERDSNLSWFLEQPAFKWAWRLFWLFLILFMIFNAKRRQRVVNVIKPLENTSLAFVKTIANLYYETNDHENLIKKKITYFLEKIRSDFNLKTNNLDEHFIEELTSKSGKEPDKVLQTINYIKWLQNRNEYHEENLITLNKVIEDFYNSK